VQNQSLPLKNYNVFEAHRGLVEAVRREGAAWAEPELRALGATMGTEAVMELGVLANAHPPVLRTHDRFGYRIDEVEFHPSWHEILRLSVGAGIHGRPWHEPRPGAHVARAAKYMLAYQNEAGQGCPITMTYAAIPAIRFQPDIEAEWGPRIVAETYDPRPIPAPQKTGVLFGMAMTEKQGGSDVRANTTRAVPCGGSGGEYTITGHKWFCSAPMCDAFLILAVAPAGLSCFLLPRFAPDGTRNAFYLQRLKDKLGNRSNASSEVEFDGAWARLVGEEGRGVRTIMEMANHTRLDCVLGSAAMMHRSVLHAYHHARQRRTFGKYLIQHDLMRNVMADLCIESEAATILAMRLARAYDSSQADPAERSLRRIATGLAKYWVCKRAIVHVAEALECLGGNGYVEEFVIARLYRECPLNSLWEGSGNVICLDVLRAIAREPASVEALLSEIRAGIAGHARLTEEMDAVEAELRSEGDFEGNARWLVERLALLLQASLLLRSCPGPIAEAFCRSRFSRRGHTFGTLEPGTNTESILARLEVPPSAS
jgi:putative acyl-CoA dehydrogenase